MLRAAFFRDFKGADTFLIWGDNRGVRTLRAGLREVHQGRRASLRIEGALGLSGLTLRVAPGDGLSEISEAESDVIWLCSPDVLMSVLESVEILGAVSHGHQFAEVRGGLASQVLISVNEYPETFR